MLFGFYILFVLRVTLFPIPYYSYRYDEFVFSPRNLNLIPLYFGECRILRFCIIGSIANVYLTIPLGFGIFFLLGGYKKKALWVSLFIGLYIELTQLLISLFLGFPYRVIDINDVLFNGLGVLIGYLIFRVFVWGYIALSKKWGSLKTGNYEYLFDVVNGSRKMKLNKPEKRIEELRHKINILKSQLPKHSVPASMLIQIEDLEEELEELENGEKES